MASEVPEVHTVFFLLYRISLHICTFLILMWDRISIVDNCNKLLKSNHIKQQFLNNQKKTFQRTPLIENLDPLMLHHLNQLHYNKRNGCPIYYFYNNNTFLTNNIYLYNFGTLIYLNYFKLIYHYFINYLQNPPPRQQYP